MVESLKRIQKWETWWRATPQSYPWRAFLLDYHRAGHSEEGAAKQHHYLWGGVSM